jgi:hypothetical protein
MLSTQVGQEFSGTSSSALLQDSLVTQCRAYFSAYHATRLDELKVHLENEGWTVCPVKQDFSFRLLAEFAHLSTLKSPTKSLTGSGSWLKRFGAVGSEESPFDELCQESLEEEDILESVGAAEDSEEELSPEQLQVQQLVASCSLLHWLLCRSCRRRTRTAAAR